MTLIDNPQAFSELAHDAPEGLNPFQAFGELLRTQPQVTIVKLAGFARGGGAEFVAAADMAFAAEGRTALAQCEALMGITPGGGGTQYLSTRMTHGRALFDAETAERYGWINRALPASERCYCRRKKHYSTDKPAKRLWLRARGLGRTPRTSCPR
ncbi:enoyl-CoA hydratase-related protein [Acetobacter conturbans]|uniref:enoyl-CoA hydratase-related protein n=1 Tax=Acetobacter conturbans TaxID=1737472 RepID=UPI001F5598FF